MKTEEFLKTEDFNEEIKTHFSKFAESFIEKNWIERWQHFLIEKPDKAFLELVKFERHRNLSSTDYFDGNFLRNLLGNNYENTEGIYFDGDKPEKIKLLEAFEKGAGNDALPHTGAAAGAYCEGLHGGRGGRL